MTDNLNNIELLKNSQKNESILVEQNIGLVKTIAKRFLFSETEYDDLVQVGTIGLLKAIRNFDTTRGVMFSTYAVPVIAGEIKKFLRDNGSVKISRVLREQYLKLQREQEKLTKELERNPTVSELAEKTGIPAEEIPLVMDAGIKPYSFEEPIGENGTMTIADTIKEKEGNEIEILALKESVKSLPPNERKLITLRYFMEKTQQETAKILGMTQVQISRKEKKILAGLKERLKC